MNLTKPSTSFASMAVFVSASIWGLYWAPLRYLESIGLDGVWAICLINLPAAILLLCIALWRGRFNVDLGQALIIGLFTGVGLALYACGLVYSSVVRATLLFYLTPIWATLIGIFWLGEQSSWQRWFAIFGGLSGLTLLVSKGGSVVFNIGDLFAFFSGVFWAIGASMIKRYNDVPLITMMMFQFIFTGVVAIFLGHLAGLIAIPSIALIKQILPFATAISLIMLIPAVCIIFWAQKHLSPGRVGILMMSEVLVAVISASIFIPEERLSIIEWTGALLIIAACLIEVLFTPQDSLKTS